MERGKGYRMKLNRQKRIFFVVGMVALAGCVSEHADQDGVAKWDANMAQRSAAVTNDIRWIDGRDLPIEGRAFADTEHYYDRLPRNVTTNVNEGVRNMKHYTSGMQFRFVTDSKKLSFNWVPYNSRLGMDHMPASGVSGIDVYRFDASKGRWLYVKTGRIWDAEKGGSLDLRWTPGTPCLVNLPLYNGVKSFALGVEPTAKVEALGPRKSGIVRPVVFYGTSITHGACASRPGMAFPSIVGRELDVPIVNLGFSGSGRSELEMSDHLAAIDASCYVIDCVWNMTQSMMDERYEKFVRNLRAKRPNVPIVLVEACYVYGEPAAGDKLGTCNATVRKVFDRLVKEGCKAVYLLPSAGQYSDDLEGTADGVHPNDWGMMHLAKAFGAVIAKALGLPAGR